MLVKTVHDFQKVDKLIIPGGESTTLINILHKHNLWDALQQFCKTKKVFGTCAGCILLSKDDQYLSAIDICVERNAYGRQLESFSTCVDTQIDDKEVQAIFIRAPKIVSAAADVEILAKYDNNPILARQNNILVATFHPELGQSLTIHNYFLEM